MEQVVGFELCVNGSAQMMMVSGATHIVKGTLMIISPVFHMYEYSRSDDYQTIRIVETIENLVSLMSRYIPLVGDVSLIRPYRMLTDEQYRFFEQAVVRISHKTAQLAQAQTDVERDMLASMLTMIRRETILEFGYLFLCAYGENQKTPSKQHMIVMKFLQSFSKHYTDHHDVEYYAAQLGLTPRHFADIIKQQTGFTPKQWIVMIMINQAKNLLARPGVQIKEVAEQLGFPEQFTFRKYFKTHTGMSPREWSQKTMSKQSNCSMVAHTADGVC